MDENEEISIQLNFKELFELANSFGDTLTAREAVAILTGTPVTKEEFEFFQSIADKLHEALHVFYGTDANKCRTHQEMRNKSDRN